MKKYYGLTVSGVLTYFDTLKEAEKYYKNYPQGTYKIGES